MKILISDIPDEGQDIGVDEIFKAEAVKLISPVTGSLNVKKVGPEVMIQGELKTGAELECSRCLKTYNCEIIVPVSVMYHPVEEMGSEGKYEVREDELDTDFYKGNEFDLLELIKEQVLLSVPMKPLCSESCRGICPKCGTDLNLNKCNCDLREVDSRLEVLKELLRRE